MTKDEKRAIRREYINYHLQHQVKSLAQIKRNIRLHEVKNFGKELRIYTRKETQS